MEFHVNVNQTIHYMLETPRYIFPAARPPISLPMHGGGLGQAVER